MVGSLKHLKKNIAGIYCLILYHFDKASKSNNKSSIESRITCRVGLTDRQGR